MNRILVSCVLAAALVAAAGCATPARRIGRNPELFASFPPEVQSLVRAGRVQIGFTKDMVRMALGDPVRVMQRETESGVSELWTWVDYDLQPGGRYEMTTLYVHDRGGRLRAVPDVMWVDHDQWYERDKIRIEFRNDKVTQIERAVER